MNEEQTQFLITRNARLRQRIRRLERSLHRDQLGIPAHELVRSFVNFVSAVRRARNAEEIERAIMDWTPLQVQTAAAAEDPQ